jgi:hypothetical protein
METLTQMKCVACRKDAPTLTERMSRSSWNFATPVPV